MTRQEAFELAKQKRKEEKAQEKENGGNYAPREYEEIQHLALDYEKMQLVRFVGMNPKDRRLDDPFSPKTVQISWILGDNDRMFRCVWPSKEEMPNWILWKIYNKIMSYKWDDTKGEKGARVYTYAESHKTAFNRVAKNNDLENSFASGWKPSTFVAFNVIDRSDMDWHRQNKHTKLLSKKGGKYFDPGIPEKMYFNLWDNIVEFYGFWDEYDVAVKKTKTGPKTTDVEYKVIHSSHLVEIDEALRPLIVSGPLTEEEKSWEMYNLNKLFGVTSYQKIKKNLGLMIKSADTSFGTHWTEELEELAAQEKKAFDEAKANEEKTTVAKPEAKAETPKEEPKAATPAPAPKEEPKKERPVRSASPAIFDPKTLGAEYKGIASLTDAMRKGILAKKADGSLEYSEAAGQILECAECHFESPESFTHCPRCGVTF